MRPGGDRKVRLDRLLVERGLSPSRERARALILAGVVLIDESVADKAGVLVNADAPVRLRGDDNPYVSRGGLKLAAAMNTLGIAVEKLVCLDVGASTGGFTDCLLQLGAAKVYAVDVGYGQLAWKLRCDPRVVVIERMNIRYLEPAAIPEPIALAVMDTSFISLKLVIPAVLPLLAARAALVALVKPQFEVGRGEVGKHGVVRDPLRQEAVVAEVAAFCRELGLRVMGTCPSPLLGPAGNREFFLYALRAPEEELP